MSYITDVITELINRLDSMVNNSDSEEMLIISKSITLLKQSLDLDLNKVALENEIQSFSQSDKIPYSEYSKLANNVFLKVGYLAGVVTNPTDYLLLVKSLVDITKYSAAYVYLNEPEKNQESLVTDIKNKYKERLTEVLQAMYSRIGSINNTEDSVLSSKSVSSALELSLESGNYKRIINLIKELDNSISIVSAQMLAKDEVLNKEIDTRCDSLQTQLTTLKSSDNPFGITKEKINLGNVDNFGNTSDVESNSESLYATAKGVNTVWEKAKVSVEDTPTDGKYYVRKDKKWVEGVLDIMPIGAVMAYSGTTAPIGWLVVEGESIHTKVMYPALYEHLKTHCSHLIIDENTFKLVNSEGMFLRGYDSEGKIDPEGGERELLSEQGDAIRNITSKAFYHVSSHSVLDSDGEFIITGGSGGNLSSLTRNITGSNESIIRFDASRVVPTSTENRPKNLNVLWIIKAYHSVSNPEILQTETIINDFNQKIDLILKERSNPNLLINGDFSVWQRGEDFNGSTKHYITDRWWVALHEGGTAVIDNDAPNGFPYSLHITSTLANFGQSIELKKSGIELFPSHTYYTLSGWYKGELATDTFHFGLRYRDIQFGSTNQNNFKPITNEFLNSSSEWKQFKIVFQSVNINPTNIILLLECNHVKGWIKIAGLKLEKGDIATSFIPDDPATNLMKCQRYYQVGIGNQFSFAPTNMNAYATFFYKQIMRTIPSMQTTFYPGSTIYEIRNDRVMIIKPSNASATTHAGFENNIILNAEF